MKTSIHVWVKCIAGVLISALLLLSGCDDNSTGSVQPPEPSEPTSTLFDNISKREGYSMFATRLETAGLSDFLQTPGNKTLVPSSDEYLEAYEVNYGRPFTDDEWKQIMQYHLLDQDITKFSTGSRNTLVTLSGDSLYLYIAPDCFVFNMNDFGECGWGAPEFVIKSTNGHIVSGMGITLPDKYIDVVSIISKRHYLSTFSHAWTSEVVDRLYNGLGNVDETFTIFVPRNNATGMNSLPTNEDDLTELLKYHILLESFTAEQLQHNQTYTTWQGEPLQITKNGNQIIVNGSATVTQTNLIGKNGVVHIINQVLTPNPTNATSTLFDNLGTTTGFENFFDHMKKAELTDFLQSPGAKTVIGTDDYYLDGYEFNLGRPLTDDDWKEVMQYHLLNQDITALPVGTTHALPTLSGEDLYLYIGSPDIFVINNPGYGVGFGPEYVVQATNGHLVVGPTNMLPNRFVNVLGIMWKRSLADNIFYEALKDTELEDRLNNKAGNPDEKFTIFMPTDEAVGTNNLSTSLLQYHILLDSFTAEQLQHNQTYTTWEGEPIQITKKGDQILINGSATITQTNLIGKNGVIHIIDQVLTRPAD